MMEHITTIILARFELECAWDINCGCCEEWATEACAQFGGEVLWLDQVQEYADRFYENNRRSDDGWDPPHTHAVLCLNNRYYDSQHPEGVNSVFELDLVRGVTRKEFLQNKLRRQTCGIGVP